VKIIEVKSYNEIPSSLLLRMYDVPYFLNGKEVTEDMEIVEVIRREYKKKYGHEPKVAWKIGKQLFVKGE